MAQSIFTHISVSISTLIYISIGRSFNLYLYMYISQSISVNSYLSIYLSVCRSFNLYVQFSFSIYLSIYLSIMNIYIYIYIYIYITSFLSISIYISISSHLSIYLYHHYHHHHVVPLARIYLTLSHHFSQSFIASGWSSGQHPVPSAAECMFKLFVLLLPGHMRGSIRVPHLWARPCFSSSVLHVWFV